MHENSRPADFLIRRATSADAEAISGVLLAAGLRA